MERGVQSVFTVVLMVHARLCERTWNRKMGNVIMITMCEATEDLGRREGIVVVEIF